MERETVHDRIRVARLALTRARMRLRVAVIRDLACDVRRAGAVDVAVSLERVAADLDDQIESLA